MMTRAVMIVLLSLLTTYSDASCPIANCVQCNNNNCTSCNDGFWLESVVCKQCPSQCSLCTHSTECQSCVTSYWNPGQLCNFVCSSNCKDSDCEDTTGYCNKCYQGKYGYTCEQYCSLCINGECDLQKCRLGCKDGYAQYNTDTGYSSCHQCSSNCIQCSNTTYCSQCEQGFYGIYYRNTIGRGTRTCTLCWEQCTQCTSIDQCPDCNSECIKQGCDESGGCVTTRSTSTAASSAKASTTSKVTQSLTETNLSPIPTYASGQTTHQSSVISTHQPICQNQCKDNCDARGKCHATTTSNSILEDAYYEGFGHGIATGIGILIVVGTLIGVGIFITRRTKCRRSICPTKTKTGSGQNHVYVNTQEDTGTMPTRTRAPHNVVNTNTEIHFTLSEEDADSNRDYVSLGERQPEHHYSDLQTNRHGDN